MTVRVLAFVAHYLPGYRFGGPVRAVANLTEALGNEIAFRVVTLDRDFRETTAYADVIPNTWKRVGKADVLYVAPDNMRWSTVRRLIDTPHDVLYLNSFFHPRFTLLPLLVHRVRRSRARVVIAPRGELAASALAIKPWRKRAFLAFARGTGLYRGVTWQASSTGELADIRRVLGSGLAGDRAILAAELLDSSPAGRADETKKIAGRLNLIFAGRVAEVKNVTFALELLRRVSHPVRFDIYGPQEDPEYLEQCRRVVGTLPANVSVAFRGGVVPEELHAAMRNADALLLPTRGENFGHAIIEALGNGCPVVISDQTPWRGLEKAGAGWDLSLDEPDAFVAVLDRLAAMGPAEHERLRRGARAYASASAEQSEVVEQNRKLFMAAAS